VAVVRRQGLNHAEHLLTQRREALDFGVDLAQSPAQQLLGRLARAHSGVTNGQEVGDVAQLQAKPLASLDERQSLDRGVVVLAVARADAVPEVAVLVVLTLEA
jgi:hypothetical protein